MPKRPRSPDGTNQWNPSSFETYKGQRRGPKRTANGRRASREFRSLLGTITRAEQAFIWRWRNDLTQTSLAIRLGVTEARVREWELGREPVPGNVPAMGNSRMREDEICKLLRRRTGMRVEELAAIIGVNPDTLKAWERGELETYRLVEWWTSDAAAPYRPYIGDRGRA